MHRLRNLIPDNLPCYFIKNVVELIDCSKENKEFMEKQVIDHSEKIKIMKEHPEKSIERNQEEDEELCDEFGTPSQNIFVTCHHVF